ncbi:hypothetical protein AB0L71_02740 [Streptomyces sp. NPDC052052]|uniref:hypothetical protein n=1 Tax=Streptomyces sp. NPDC052052 TaxID=3154756 RepID=UPI00342F44CE
MLAETICSAASAAGLGIAAVMAYRKRFLRAARIAAYSLVPIGLVLTGIVDWVAGIAFKPSVWIGFGLLAVAWLLFISTRAVENRGVGAGKGSKAAERAAGSDALAPAASAPSRGAALPATRTRAEAEPKRKSGPADDDFSDIEAILKKHGI